MCEALRPEGIAWPTREDGTPSFKLELLATANHLQQERAHDALSDVHALIGLARLIRARQPRLWDWFYALRRKQRVFELLDVAGMTPLVHVSSRYPASRHCLALIAPLAQHPGRPGEVIVCDLADDPAEWLQLDEDEIADRVFTPRADLPEGVARIPLRTVRANRAPALAPLSALKGADLARLQLDPECCLAHRDALAAADGLAAKVARVFARAAELPPAEDPELALYGGFLPDADKRLLREVRATPPEQLATRSRSAIRATPSCCSATAPATGPTPWTARSASAGEPSGASASPARRRSPRSPSTTTSPRSPRCAPIPPGRTSCRCWTSCRPGANSWPPN